MNSFDPKTLAIYDRQAAQIVHRHNQIGDELIAELAQWLHPAVLTADIGSGGGRYAAWLAVAGFSVVGYDASRGMLAEARAAHPQVDFRLAHLPDLTEIADASFDNLLCAAVLMHLPASAIEPALTNLVRVLRPAGRLVLTWRTSMYADREREDDGRLFTDISLAEVTTHLQTYRMRILTQYERPQPDRSTVIWRMVAAERL